MAVTIPSSSSSSSVFVVAQCLLLGVAVSLAPRQRDNRVHLIDVFLSPANVTAFENKTSSTTVVAHLELQHIGLATTTTGANNIQAHHLPALLDTGSSMTLLFPSARPEDAPSCVVVGRSDGASGSGGGTLTDPSLRSGRVLRFCLKPHVGNASQAHRISSQVEAYSDALRRLRRHTTRRMTLRMADGGAVRGRLVDVLVARVALAVLSSCLPSDTISQSAFQEHVESRQRFLQHHVMLVERVNEQFEHTVIAQMLSSAAAGIDVRVVLGASPVAVHSWLVAASLITPLPLHLSRRIVSRDAPNHIIVFLQNRGQRCEDKYPGNVCSQLSLYDRQSRGAHMPIYAAPFPALPKAFSAYLTGAQISNGLQVTHKIDSPDHHLVLFDTGHPHLRLSKEIFDLLVMPVICGLHQSGYHIGGPSIKNDMLLACSRDHHTPQRLNHTTLGRSLSIGMLSLNTMVLRVLLRGRSADLRPSRVEHHDGSSTPNANVILSLPVSNFIRCSPPSSESGENMASCHVFADTDFSMQYSKVKGAAMILGAQLLSSNDVAFSSEGEFGVFAGKYHAAGSTTLTGLTLDTVPLDPVAGGDISVRLWSFGVTVLGFVIGLVGWRYYFSKRFCCRAASKQHRRI
jgi:hypothetical protein